MKYGVNNETFRGRFIKNFKRKTPNESSPKIIQGTRKKSWISWHQHEACLNTAQEIFPKPRLALLVPSVSLGDIIPAASGVKITFSSMQGACPLLDISPRDPRGRILRVLLLAATEFLALRVRNRIGITFYNQTVPNIFDKLKALCPTQFEDRREFGIHRTKMEESTEYFKTDSQN